MRPGRAARRSDVADHVAALDGGADADRERTQMAVACRQPEPVLEHDEVAVIAGIGRRLDDAVGRGVDGLAFFGRDVETLMEPRLARERIASTAEGAGQP